MADRKYYVICETGCRFESMTKEQILTAIMQAVNEGKIGNIDAGFITTIKTINGKALKFFVGEQSEYERLSAAEREGLFAIITNDTSKEAFEKALAVLQKEIEALQRTESRTADLTWDGTSARGSVEFEANSTYLITCAAGDGTIATFVLHILENKVTDASCTHNAYHHMLRYYQDTKELVYRRYHYIDDGSSSGIGYVEMTGSITTVTYAKIANIT